MPVRSHHLPYLLAELSISYVGGILNSVAAWLARRVAIIIIVALLIEAVRLIGVVILKRTIRNRGLAFVPRPDFEITSGALRYWRYLCCDLIALYFIIGFSINFVRNEVRVISRRLMCKNETLFLFRRHCLIHYNGIILIIFLLF